MVWQFAHVCYTARGRMAVTTEILPGILGKDAAMNILRPIFRVRRQPKPSTWPAHIWLQVLQAETIKLCDL